MNPTGKLINAFLELVLFVVAMIAGFREDWNIAFYVLAVLALSVLVDIRREVERR